MSGASEPEAREFAAAFRSFLDWVRSAQGERNEVCALVCDFPLDDLLDSGQQLTRSLLGVGNDPESLPPGGGIGSLPPQRGRAWAGPARPGFRRIVR